MQPSTFSSAPPESSARRGGLIGWGVVLIVIGAIVAVAMIVVLMTWLQQIEGSLANQATPQRRGSGPRPRAIRWTDFVGTLSVLAAAAGLVWTGIASCLARRWARPIIVIASFITMAVATLILVRFFVTLPAAMEVLSTAQARNRTVAGDPSPYSIVLLYLIRAALIIVFGIVVPWLCYRFYISPRTAQLLDQLDRRGSWTDRCPIPVLGWAAFCALTALWAVLRIGDPALPAFYVVLTGAAAIIGLSALAVLLAWGAWLCYRMDRLGWILTFVLIAALYLATPVYLLTGGTLADLSSAPVRAMSGTDDAPKSFLPPWEHTLSSSLEAILVIMIGLYVARSFSTRYHATLLPRRAS